MLMKFAEKPLTSNSFSGDSFTDQNVMYIPGFWEKQFSNWKNKTEKKTLNEKYSDSEIKIEVDWLLSL